jgi:hypothetical protein
MTTGMIAQRTGWEVLVRGGAFDRPIRKVVASDLMSDVLVVDEEDILLLTSLVSDQVLRTAHVIGAVGVVLVNGKPLPSSMLAVAGGLGVSLLTAPLSKYDACVTLHQLFAHSCPPAGNPSP